MQNQENSREKHFSSMQPFSHVKKTSTICMQSFVKRFSLIFPKVACGQLSWPILDTFALLVMLDAYQAITSNISVDELLQFYAA